MQESYQRKQIDRHSVREDILINIFIVYGLQAVLREEVFKTVLVANDNA